MLEKELEIAIALAREAGRIIQDFYALEIIAEEKFGIDNFAEPVTLADRTASRIIVEGLAQSFPLDAILSEEEPDESAKRLSSNRVWFIDPIDGTSGFIKKDGDFAVHIGLTENGIPVVGVVLLPVRNALYFASRGQGSFLVENGEPPARLQVSDKIDFTKMNLAVSRHHRSPKMGRIIEDFGFRKEIPRGSVGLKVGLITEQICDFYIHLSARTKFWDTCGPQVILEEAGGKLTDIFGASIGYGLRDVQNHNGILASNGSSHESAVRNLGPILNDLGRFKRGAADGN